MSNRWQLNRVGLVNFWYYTQETFTFAEGHLLLRGTNGSGKSLTMQSLFPVLLDGDTSAYRLDSFGSRDRKMEDYLLGEKGVAKRDEGIGYLWLEVKREQREEYLTVGLGLQANRGGKLKKWYWSLENNQRIDFDFKLVEEPRKNEILPLTRAKLKNQLVGKGQLFNQRIDYQSFVNQRIFNFASLEQFDELLNLLIQIRSPKLSKDFRPSVIYGILRNSLPQLKDDELQPLAKTIQQLDAHREHVTELKKEMKELKLFAKAYDRWQGNFLGQIQTRWQQLTKVQADLQQELATLQQAYSTKEATLKNNRQQFQKNQQELEQLALVIEQLSQHEGMDLVKQGVRLAQQLQRSEELLAQLKKDLKRKEEQLTTSQTQLAAQELQEADLLHELQGLVADNQQYLPYMQLSLLDEAYSQKLFQGLTIAEQKYWLQQVTAKKDHFNQVLGSMKKLAADEEDLQGLEREIGQLQQKIDGLLREVQHWQQLRQGELEKWKQALDQWRLTAAFPLAATDYEHLLANLDTLLTAEEREEVLLAPLTDAYQRALKQKNLAMVPLENQQAANRQQISTLVEEIRSWQGQKIPEPERSQARLANRENWSPAIPYLLFYQSVDFLPAVPAALRNKLEGALHAAGILDGVISQGALSLAADLKITPQPQLFAETLSKVLKVSADVPSVLVPEVTAILDSICLGELGVDTTSGAPLIFTDGTWQLANIEGAMVPNYQASFIGLSSQERFKKEQIARLNAEKEALQQQNVTIAAQLEQLKTDMIAMDTSYQARPRGTEVFQTFIQQQTLNTQQQVFQQALTKQDEHAQVLREQIYQQRSTLTSLTAGDELILQPENYEEARRYTENYRLNLSDAFQVTLRRQHAGEFIQTLRQNVADYQEDTQAFWERQQEQQGTVASLKRQLVENKAQQQALDVAALQARLTQAITQQNHLKEDQLTLMESRSTLDIQLTTQKVAIEQATTEMTRVSFLVEHWQVLYEKEWQRSGLDQPTLVTSNGLTIKELKRLEDEVVQKFGFMADQLQRYNPQLITVTGLPLTAEVEEQLAELPYYNNHREPRFVLNRQELTVAELLALLSENQVTAQNLLQAEDDQLFRQVILESVGKYLRSRITQAEKWVQQMNELLGMRKNSSGLSLSIYWKPRPADSAADLSTVELVRLLQKPTELLAPQDQEALSRHFQEKVRFAQEQLENNEEGQSTLFQAISLVLDYRDWFDFELKFKRSNEGYPWQPLTDRRFNQFSGGEKAVAMYLPLFAAASSRYRDAGAACPQVITLDEAFAGIDEENIADLFAACQQLDFNYVMNSQALFGDYATVSSLAIYELMRPQNAPFVDVIHYHWNGAEKRLVLPEAEHE